MSNGVPLDDPSSTLPDTMFAVEIFEPGGPDVLVAVQRPVPEPKRGEVLIAVEAAGVNRPDVLQRMGAYPPPPGASDLPGLEVAGRVVANNGVAEPAVGRSVMALTPGGGYAQYVTVPAGHCLSKPEGLTMEQAAAIPETLFTVWHNVFRLGQLTKGETLLVHGGSSGIGTMAIQLAVARGARVIATAGSAEKCEACEHLGAVAVNYHETDFVDAVREHTDGRGANVVLDMVGGSYVNRNYRAAAEDGRIVQIATLGGASATADVSLLMRKRLLHTGSTLRPRTNTFKSDLARELEREVLPLIASGRVRPVMDRTFALKDAAAAHRRMEGGDHIGKMVLRV